MKYNWVVDAKLETSSSCQEKEREVKGKEGWNKKINLEWRIFLKDNTLPDIKIGISMRKLIWETFFIQNEKSGKYMNKCL